jgi:hypothetical protein
MHGRRFVDLTPEYETRLLACRDPTDDLYVSRSRGTGMAVARCGSRGGRVCYWAENSDILWKPTGAWPDAFQRIVDYSVQSQARERKQLNQQRAIEMMARGDLHQNTSRLSILILAVDPEYSEHSKYDQSPINILRQRLLCAHLPGLVIWTHVLHDAKHLSNYLDKNEVDAIILMDPKLFQDRHLATSSSAVHSNSCMTLDARKSLLEAVHKGVCVIMTGGFMELEFLNFEGSSQQYDMNDIFNDLGVDWRASSVAPTEAGYSAIGWRSGNPDLNDRVQFSGRSVQFPLPVGAEPWYIVEHKPGE